MPIRAGESDDARDRRGPYYAAVRRINQNKEFFEKVWHIQPRCMAVFGPAVEPTFLKLHQARRNIEVAAQMLAERVVNQHDPDDKATRDLYERMRRDIWDTEHFELDKDETGKLLTQFVEETATFATPVVEEMWQQPSSFAWKIWMWFRRPFFRLQRLPPKQ